jgi:carbamate kinase
MPDIHLRADNGQYVCAEGGGGREVVANRDRAQEWETFTLELIDGRFRGDSRIALRADNGQYVCAEGGGGREVVANRDSAREWETFTVERVPGRRGRGNVRTGDSIALRADNGQYVCAEGGGGREVVANRDRAQEWETFTVELI